MNGYIVLYFRNRSARAKLQESARRYVTADQGTERLTERALQVLSDNPSLLDERDDNRAMFAGSQACSGTAPNNWRPVAMRERGRHLRALNEPSSTVRVQRSKFALARYEQKKRDAMGVATTNFEDTVYGIEANLLVLRAASALTAAGIPITRRSIEEYMGRYFSRDLVDKHRVEINFIIVDILASVKDLDKGFAWNMDG